jgi:heat shock protein HslJ/LysM repeat protein
MKRLIITVTVLALLTLILPGLALAQAPVACEDEYTVQAGDWLSKIAEKYYGDVLAYPAIVIAANIDSNDTYTDIVDPNLIEPGWTLCIPSGEDMARLMAMSVGTAPPGLSEVELANATYRSEWTQAGMAPLIDGEYSEAAAPGSATKTEVILTPFMAYGRLNDQDVAAVVLVTLPGGSGSFYDLHVVVSQDGQLVDVASAFLGDRVEINSIVIENGQIKVDMVQAGPDDPMCCPGQHVIKTYELQGDQLVEVSSEVVGPAGKPELIGTLWRWDQTAMNNGDKLVPDNPNNYTVEFFPDGRVSAQADCNRANGTYTVDGSSISIEILQMTMAACPPGSLGDDFVKNLNEATIYFIEGKNLFVDLKFDSGTMKFSAVRPISLAGTSWLVRGYSTWTTTRVISSCCSA